jgi:peptidoglycan/xylan/chitin deacetylase (PgdA/CDA1 family)
MKAASVMKAGLDVMYYSGASHAIRPFWMGIGAVFMLHHVRPGGPAPGAFAPNRALSVTPEYLDQVITKVRDMGYDLISLEEAARHISSGETPRRPFAVFTLDDGYVDNMVHAWPVFRKHNCPFTIFVAPAITEGRSELWWIGLESVIAAETRIATEIEGQAISGDTITDAQKTAVFDRIYWPLRGMENRAQRRYIRKLCEGTGIDLDAMCRAAAMTWDDLAHMAKDPLCEIGAHTMNHYALSRLSAEEVLEEAQASRDEIEHRLGRRPTLFAYPYGDETSAGPRDFALIKEAGFTAAVTTRKGLIARGHAGHMTALPRVSLNGHFQKLRYLDVLLSGLAFMPLNRFRAVNAR